MNRPKTNIKIPRVKIFIAIVTLASFVLFQADFCLAAPGVTINEIAWMGTAANSADEWIELYNNTDQEISLEGWALNSQTAAETEEALLVGLTGTIPAKSFYLIERTDDNTIADVPAELVGSWGRNGLSNAGEKITLKDQGQNIIDEVDCSAGWFAGLASLGYRTMEKINPTGASLVDNWATNDGQLVTGLDAAGNPISGSPKATNSIAQLPAPSPTPTATPEPTPAPTPTNELSPTPSPSPTASSEPAPEPTAASSPTPEPSPSASPAPSPTPDPCSTDIILIEFMPYPPKDQKEWAKLFNAGPSSISLTGWKIADNKNHSQAVPENTIINPGQSLIVYLNNAFLNNDGDQVTLLCPDGQTRQTVSYDKAKQSIPCVRQSSGQWLCEPSPASALNQQPPPPSPPATPTPKPGPPAAPSAPAIPSISPLKGAAVSDILTETTQPAKSLSSLASIVSAIKNTLAPPEQESAADETLPEQNKKADFAAAASAPPDKTNQLKKYLWLGATIISAGLAGLGFLHFKKRLPKSEKNSEADF